MSKLAAAAAGHAGGLFARWTKTYNPERKAKTVVDADAIQRLIQDPLDMKLLDGDVKAGEALTVDADLKKGEMIFKPGKAKAA